MSSLLAEQREVLRDLLESSTDPIRDRELKALLGFIKYLVDGQFEAFAETKASDVGRAEPVPAEDLMELDHQGLNDEPENSGE